MVKQLSNTKVTSTMRSDHFDATGSYVSDDDIAEWYDKKVSEISTPIIQNKQPAHKATNVGTSDYAKHSIQPWDIWREYSLNPWDADIIKRVLRTKEGDSRKLDYEKIAHICQERISQLDGEYN